MANIFLSIDGKYYSLIDGKYFSLIDVKYFSLIDGKYFSVEHRSDLLVHVAQEINIREITITGSRSVLAQEMLKLIN